MEGKDLHNLVLGLHPYTFSRRKSYYNNREITKVAIDQALSLSNMRSNNRIVGIVFL